MKANEAPEKLYISSKQRPDKEIFYGACTKVEDDDIEYTRTDAFIEKALKWYCLDCECNDNCKDIKCFFYREYERYLKGWTNALPPKFYDRILNEDGTTSDNWRYRHFITKIQDAFIEKACRCYCDDICENGMSGMCFHKHDGQGQIKNSFKYNECNELKLLIKAMKG